MSDKTTSRPQPQRGVLEINAYKPGGHKAPGTDKVYKLSSNESGIGASPLAIEAYEKTARKLEIYPDGYAEELRLALADHYGLNPENLIFGAGSDEILSMIATAFLEPGSEAIYSQYGFLMYPIIIRAAGATPVIVPEKNYTVDIDAIIAAITDKTRVIFLANPNNPTGTYISFSEVRRLYEALPKTVLLVLDAAYAEFIRHNDYQAGIELAGNHENVIMTRTFSKLYGLAGLRLGWGFASEYIIDLLNRVRAPHNLNCGAIAAGIAALQDKNFLDKALAHNDEWLPKCINALREAGFEVTDSVGNFILVHFPTTPGKTAQDAYNFLLQRGVIVRPMGAYGLPNALRISIGSIDANEAMITAMNAFAKS